tara:strand:+ start:861 stop:1031 length:171 start_codon:yes stop_codon:yes gene_type:complete
MAALCARMLYDVAGRAEDMHTLEWEHLEINEDGSALVKVLAGKTVGGQQAFRPRTV